MSQDNSSENNLVLIKEKLSSGTYSQISRMLNKLHPNDIARFIESSPPSDREFVWQILDKEIEGEVLNQLPNSLQEDFLEDMEASEVLEITEALEPDEIADIIQRLPEAVIEEVLSSMSAQNRERIEQVLSYPEDSAGGLMNTDVIAVRRSPTLDVVLRYLRIQGNFPSSTDKIFVVSRENEYKGFIHLNQLLISDPSLHVEDIYTKDSDAIEVITSDNDVARIF